MSASARAVLALGLVCAVSCSKPTDSPGEGPPKADGQISPTQAEGASSIQTPVPDEAMTVAEVLPDAGKPAKLGPDDITPVIRAIGPQGAIPRAVVVQFSTEVTTEADRSAGEPTRLRFEPEMEGELAFTTKTSLTFTPFDAFLPGVMYAVHLEAVESRDGVIRPEKPWTYRFIAPKFQFLRVSSPRVPTRGRVELDVVFSADVEPASLGRFASWTIDGEPVAQPTYHSTDEPHVVRVRLSSRLAMAGCEVKLALQAGVPFNHSSHVATAPGAGAKVTVETRPKVEILAAVRRQGPAGHYIEVVCNDDAAEGGERSFWDSEAYEHYWVSRRCVLTDAAGAEHTHFEPKVAFQISASRAGFRITGKFERGGYTLRIGTGARTVDGGSVYESYETSLTIPPRSPSVQFVSKGRYLPRRAWRHLAVRHMNVKSVELTVRHVPRQNLIFWLSNDNERADNRTSDQILKTQLAVASPPDRQETTWIDVGALVPSPRPGVYELTIMAEGKRDAARLLLTELNLVAKQSRPAPGAAWAEEIAVWALDMSEATLKAGVEVKLVRASGKVLSHCKTDPNGGCRLKVPPKGVDASPPFALVATQGEQLTYLRFADVKTEITEAPVHGRAYRARSPYQAALYGDRGVYRPGETAHVVAIVRDRKHKAPKAGVPVELHLSDPRQKLSRKIPARTNPAGVAAFDLDFVDFAPTGRYSAELKIAKETIGRLAFNVEEFVPERMKVEAKLDKPGYLNTQEATVEVSARYLFGGTATGDEVQVNCRLDPGPFRPKKNTDYRYGAAYFDEKAPKTLSMGSANGRLGADGRDQIACPTLEQASGFPCAGKLVANVAVLEAGSGRTTQVEVRAPVHPERYYIGLKTRTSRAEVGQAFVAEGLIVDWTGAKYRGPPDNPAPSTVDVEIIRRVSEYGWYYDEEEGEEHYARHERPIVESRRSVPVKGSAFKIRVVPEGRAASYVVRVRAGLAQTDLQIDGVEDAYAWSWRARDSSTDHTPRPLKPAELKLALPEKIEVGQASKLRFEAPYKGIALLTVETHRVLTATWMPVTAGQNEWSFTVDAYWPNVYVSAFVVKDPYLDSDEMFMPDRAFGVRSVRVKPSAYFRSVKLTAPQEIEPNRTLEIGLDLGPIKEPTFATVAAVDEGILSLTRFKDPDPLARLFDKRGLAVDTFETVGWALRMSPAGPSSSTGGDEEEAPGRIMPVKPVALWSGLVEVPKSGKLTVKLDVPQYRGALRIMAVTAGGTRIGRARAMVKVRDPIVLQTTLPRFLTAGDRIQIPVFVTNLSGAAQEITVRMTAHEISVPGMDAALSQSPIVEMRGARERALRLEEGGAGTVVFEATALRQAGAATFRVEATAGKHRSFDELDVPFVPAGPRIRVVKQLELAAGATDLKPHLTGWVPTSESSTLWVTNLPYAEALSHLSHLVRYPHGCIEQTTSSTRPLLFVSKLLPQIDPVAAAKHGNIEKMVMHGVRRVLSMQTPSGGFSYWPGGTHPHLWGTAYATHMLLDARDAGYAVPAERIDEAVKFLEISATHDTGRRYDRYADGYLHYVLARAGKGRKARIQALIDDLDRVAKAQDAKGDVRPYVRDKRIEDRYLLMAAAHLAGDRRYDKKLKQLAGDAAAGSKTLRGTGGSFYSSRRRRGLMLTLFHGLFGRDSAGEALARTVARDLAGQSSRYYTTQELMWGITGLGQWVEQGASDYSPPVLSGNGKTLAPQALAAGAKPRKDRTWTVPRASEYRDLGLRIDQKGQGKLYLMLSSQGVRTDGKVVEGGEGLSLERAYLTAEGKVIPPEKASVTLGDVIYTRIRLGNETQNTVENVVLVDRFPAGWEIENPRLGRSRAHEMSWVDADDLWEADYMNLRDDRLEMFGTLDAGQTVEVVYAHRVVTAGRFQAPPVEAEAMYDPALWAREKGTLVSVAGPWDGYID